MFFSIKQSLIVYHYYTNVMFAIDNRLMNYMYINNHACRFSNISCSLLIVGFHSYAVGSFIFIRSRLVPALRYFRLFFFHLSQSVLENMLSSLKVLEFRANMNYSTSGLRFFRMLNTALAKSSSQNLQTLNNSIHGRDWDTLILLVEIP